VAEHPFSRVVIAAVHNTAQARQLEGQTSFGLALEASRVALEAAGLEAAEVDGFFGPFSSRLLYTLGAGPAHSTIGGPPAIIEVLEAASAIAAGLCTVALIAGGGAATYRVHEATAPWTRPEHEFVASYGMFTPVHFALIARRHMEVFGTRPEHLAAVAATIRNNGHVNPQATYYGRGPFTAEDVLASRMVADPFHLLDCATTSEGGCAVVLTSVDRANDLESTPVRLLGGGHDCLGPIYEFPPSWDFRAGRGGDSIPNGYVGRRAARRAFAMAGLSPQDVDVCEFYDPFSFELIRQYEAFEFCADGEGADFVLGGNIGPGERYPVTTDGGTMAFGHAGGGVPALQRVVRAVQQLQGSCVSNQVLGAEVAMCTNGGAGALFTDVLLLGTESP
jgi:acetyl-CoA acetyltransferase